MYLLIDRHHEGVNCPLRIYLISAARKLMVLLEFWRKFKIYKSHAVNVNKTNLQTCVYIVCQTSEIHAIFAICEYICYSKPVEAL